MNGGKVKAKKFLPLTWFCLGIIAADCLVTISLIRLGWAYEANKLFYIIKLPIELMLAIKFVTSVIGLVVIEYFRQKYEYEKRFASWAMLVLAIIYSAAMISAWTNLVIQNIHTS